MQSSMRYDNDDDQVLSVSPLDQTIKETFYLLISELLCFQLLNIFCRFASSPI